MNCFDCANEGGPVAAIAVCHRCGAAICGNHAIVEPHHLTRTGTMGVQVPVDPPARLIWCGVCHSALEAKVREQHSHGGHPIHNPFHRHHDEPAVSQPDA